MKKLIIFFFVFGIFFTGYSQKVVRIVKGTKDYSFSEPVKCYRYDSTEVDILVWKFQKKLDEAWKIVQQGKLFDSDFDYSLIKAKSDAQEKVKGFNFELYYKEWQLYHGTWTDEVLGPYVLKEE